MVIVCVLACSIVVLTGFLHWHDRNYAQSVEDKIHGLYGHSERRVQAFRNVLREQRNY